MIEDCHAAEKERKIENSDAFIIEDKKNTYSLKTELREDTLKFDFKYYDMQKGEVHFFERKLFNEDLPKKLRCIFGSTEGLFNQCFAQKKNYHTQRSGFIKITYQIVLRNQTLNKTEKIQLF